MNRTDRWGRALIPALPATPSLAGAHMLLDGRSIALDGFVAIEAEFTSTFPGSCRSAATRSAANLKDPELARLPCRPAGRRARSIAGDAVTPGSQDRPDSEFVSGDGTPPPPPPPSGAVKPLTVDGSRQWLIRQKTA